MKTIELKLKQKSQYEYQLKEGAKVIAKITKVSDGWSIYSCTTRETLENAIEYARRSQEETLNAFGGDYKVVVK